MKTKIIHYGLDDETYILPGTYDSHTDETGQGVYGKPEMLEFVRIVTEHFLTPRQRYFYFQCVVYGKKVEDIAALEGVDDSTVYKHLKLAKQKIANVKELMRIAGGKKSTFVLFQQIISDFGKEKKTIATDFYINGITAMQIADKNETDFVSIKNYINAIRKKLTSKGLTEDDLKFIRNYYKKQRSVSNGSNGN